MESFPDSRSSRSLLGALRVLGEHAGKSDRCLVYLQSFLTLPRLFLERGRERGGSDLTRTWEHRFVFIVIICVLNLYLLMGNREFLLMTRI